MDDLKLLSQMRKDVPAPSQRAVNTALRQLAQATDGRRRSPLRGMAGTGSAGRPRRLRRLAVAGGLSLAVAAGTVAAQAFQPGAVHPHGNTGPARLAAWTVARRPDGVLRIYMRQLRDPAGLRALLRKDGVPSKIEFVHHPIQATTSQDVIPRSCKPLRLTDEANTKLQEKIFPFVGTPPNKAGVSNEVPWILAIRPSAIPAGVGMFWQVWLVKGASGPFVWNLDLVQTGPRCTGS